MTPRTDLYCAMGNPVAHSRSPWIHARFAELAGERVRQAGAANTLVLAELLAP